VQLFIINFVSLLFNILTFAVFARVLMSWVPIPQNNRFVQILIEITEPILGPVRRVIPPIGMLDISPIVALLLLQVLENILVSSLRGA
jgi:YggT family protein